MALDRKQIRRGTSGNRLLDRLLRIDPSLAERATRTNGDVGHYHVRSGDLLNRLLFPAGGVLSLVVPMASGIEAEVYVVGVEGMVGMHALAGVSRSPIGIRQLVPGPLVALSVADMRRSITAHPALENELQRWSVMHLRAGHQLVACNGVHGARSRTARWILSTADRCGSDQFPLTQDRLAQLLVISRPFVNRIAAEFRLRGMIHYVRGHVRIVQRRRLEAEACECYATISALYRQLQV